MLTANDVEIGEPTLQKLNELLLKHQNKIAILVHTDSRQYKFSMNDPRYTEETGIVLGVVSGSITPRDNDDGPYQFPFSDRYIRLNNVNEHAEHLGIANGTNPFLYRSDFQDFLAAMAIRLKIWKAPEQLRLYYEPKYDFVAGEEEIKQWFKEHVELWMFDLDIRLFKATTILGQPIKVDSPFFLRKLQERREKVQQQFKRLTQEQGKDEQLKLLKAEMSALGIK